jgi:GTP-binding protein
VKRSPAEFVISAASIGDYPRPDLPDIVMAGRSNVGKSSLINALTRIRNIAKTSSTPGKTQLINFFRIHGLFYLVDLPGFGYAKAGKAKRQQWKRLIDDYFMNRPTIALVVHLIDARIAPTVLDIELEEWLDHLGVPRLIAATKSDKLSGNARAKQKRAISSYFGRVPVILCSSLTGFGCKEIWSCVIEAAREEKTAGTQRDHTTPFPHQEGTNA